LLKKCGGYRRQREGKRGKERGKRKGERKRKKDSTQKIPLSTVFPKVRLRRTTKMIFFGVLLINQKVSGAKGRGNH
jgi:hypothetical protein